MVEESRRGPRLLPPRALEPTQPVAVVDLASRVNGCTAAPEIGSSTEGGATSWLPGFTTTAGGQGAMWKGQQLHSSPVGEAGEAAARQSEKWAKGSVAS
jgi:hypothetical protein